MMQKYSVAGRTGMRSSWGIGIVALVGVTATGCADERGRADPAPRLGSDDPVIRELVLEHELREGVLSLPFEGDVEILYAMIDGRPIWAGDIVLDEAQLQGFRAASTTRLWPGGTINYVFDATLPAATRAGVLQSMEEWATKTGIRFVEGQPPGEGYVLIERGDADDCSAHLGYYGPQEHELTLGENCDDPGTYAHELGHVIGLFHEQSRSDRDEHVTIHWDNIAPDMAYIFDKYEKEEAGHDRGPYDYASIMHYASEAFAADPAKPVITRKTGEWIPWPNAISQGDVMAVKAMYAVQPQDQDGAADDPAAPQSGCTGLCGSLQPTPEGCYCDQGCVDFGDCCADQQTVCDGGKDNSPGGAATCAGRCGAAGGQPDGNGGQCYCDEICTQNNDCCADYPMQCVDDAPDGNDGGGDDGGDGDGGAATCVNHCGGQGSQGPSCWCDEQCSSNGDCCPDYEMACGADGGDGGGGDPSCNGHCNSPDPIDGCYCDPTCLDYGDCCPDYGSVCQ